MRKSYCQKTSRSRRSRVKPPVGRTISIDDQEIQIALPIPALLASLHGHLESIAGAAGMLMIQSLVERDVTQLVGPRYAHAPDRTAVRWGSEDGFVTFAGRKVPIRRPRVRSTDGQEVPVRAYEAFQDDSRMGAEVSQRILRRVSTRNYEGVLDEFCDGYGIQRSSVSRHWKAATEKELRALFERDLSAQQFAVIMIDGIRFQESLQIAAVGMTSDGTKQVLGIWEGATENTTVVTELLADLVKRGLDPNRRYLFVIDGSKALRKGIETVFGSRAEVHRCHLHKLRNVLSHLPENHHVLVRRALKAAWGMRRYDDAKAALLKLVSKLEGMSPSAAQSLKEGLEDTLTIHRLQLPEQLADFLRTTNAIESVFARTRDLCRNVKNWRSPGMALRWSSTMLLHAEKSFRRVRGHRGMSDLVRALAGMDRKEAVA